MSQFDGSCERCAESCDNDSGCAAFECGNGYCSWWAAGVCDVEDSNNQNNNFQTCRFQRAGEETLAGTISSSGDTVDHTWSGVVAGETYVIEVVLGSLGDSVMCTLSRVDLVALAL